MNTTTMQAPTLSPGWRRALLALLALWLVTGWQYRDTVLAMTKIWDTRETFTHAWVVPPITFWLMWRLRGQVLAITPRASLWALVMMAVVCMAWLAGEVVAVAAATQFAVVALFVLAVPALLGWQVARVLAFPLGFIFFCVPVGEFLSPTLMGWTANFTVSALRASGIPVYQEGLQFVIPSGRWSVIEACSGIRYLIASIMVGTLFAYLNYNSLRRRLVFVGISIIVPLVANWLRAYMIVMLGHLSGNQLAVGADHLLYGWVFFGIVIMALYWIGARWAEVPPEEPPFQQAGGEWSVSRGGLVALAAAGLMAAPLLMWQHIEAATSAAPVSLSLPDALPGGWQRADDPVPRWKPSFFNPSASSRVAYRAPNGATVGVYVAYYRKQDQDRKLVSSANRMVANGDSEWQLMSLVEREAATATGAFKVREGSILQSESPGQARQRLRVWQTYRIDGVYVANNILGKLHGAWSRLRGRGDDSAVLMVFADEGDAGAEAKLSAFLSQALPALTTAIDAPQRALTSP
jgi:exosortase A